MTRRAERMPMSALTLLRQEVSELFHRLAALDRAEQLPSGEWSPPTDVFELRDRLVVVAEVPGLTPDSLRITIQDRTLVLGGERRARRAVAGTSFLCVERPHGRFERRIPLDLPVDVARARATLSGGILTVNLPRLRERRGRETVIPIEREPAR